MKITRPQEDYAWLDERVRNVGGRPLRLFDRRRFEDNLVLLMEVTSELAKKLGVDCNVSYSVKTNPSADVLSIVEARGFGVECISLAELEYVQRMGFDGRRCTLNGPGKWWPDELLPVVQEPSLINCDSIGDVRKTLDVLDECGWDACTLGIRVSAPGLPTRFGVDLEDSANHEYLREVLRSVLPARRLGVHMHHAQSAIGATRWVGAVARSADLASSLLRSTMRECSLFDLGGGWSTIWGNDFRVGLERACRGVLDRLHTVRSLQIEPGKALVEECGYVVCRVLGRRGLGPDSDLVVSAAISDVPDAVSFEHDILWRKANGGRWEALQDGSARVLGRLCMEADILRAGVSIPAELDEGDLVVICGTGGYDTSMAFSFGMGDDERYLGDEAALSAANVNRHWQR